MPSAASRDTGPSGSPTFTWEPADAKRNSSSISCGTPSPNICIWSVTSSTSGGCGGPGHGGRRTTRSEEHTSELQSLMRISYAVFCLKKKNTKMHEYKKNNIDIT